MNSDLRNLRALNLRKSAGKISNRIINHFPQISLINAENAQI
jgi:hypothetical protein